ncbi:dTDP-4-dehydrorhamnose reductase [Noviherbaspirillum aridicola]|uniref:dTDP-4-dehydrorhamnose reductase n=1 Tax=Noviherbaspirillum aridicola TaxID=2849687 RepID=A0ABQ4Q2P4_9BURK|nr:dTDP-4-dehydrorhamnose reductase [Noviherbaspirillum aridicola]GIZ51317.1 NAD(P)-dependent oxidoreductase [Noviherbaspirillum aridicola]
MKILLFGKGGQVGWELQRSLAPLGEVVAMGTAEADFEQPEELSALVRRTAPDVIVNAAAYTAVDKAESEAARAYLINTEAVGALAEETARLGGWLIHYSTDYVFNGEKPDPYQEDDLPGPLSVYGKSKLAGEELIRKSGAQHLIFRTSWVFAARGGNFAKTMLKLARERDELRVVADQYGAPTSAELIADVSALALHRVSKASGSDNDFSGTYHLAAAGVTSWHGYASFILEVARSRGIDLRVKPEQVQAIPASAYPVPAPRPRNSQLNTARLRDTFGVYLPDWRYHVRRMMDEITL